ncbi:histidine kinase, partial [Vibrio sp.]|uniref:histidine kinase n=1 Tax=Vibrio sp. TaxID=678 RepID=UPI003D10A605
LTSTFNEMSHELGKLYRDLEQAVDEKTKELQHANQSLQVLYNSSQELSASRITAENFQSILQHIASLEGVTWVRLEVNEVGENPLYLQEGEGHAQNHGRRELSLDGQHLGYLDWDFATITPDQALLDSFVLILSRAIYYNQSQRQAEKLLLMEERATIARELHDSLAQSLSYLKIQVSFLKKSVNKLPDNDKVEQTKQIISELDTGLTSAYTQLRELLTTFRLKIKQGSFGQALSEMVSQLDDRSDATILLSNNLSSIELEANQQVHLLQLIREATINAIKHAKAHKIHICCSESDELVTVSIKDDGVGFETNIEKINHYGMSIMQERAARLGGELVIKAAPGSGCEVMLTYQKN